MAAALSLKLELTPPVVPPKKTPENPQQVVRFQTPPAAAAANAPPPPPLAMAGLKVTAIASAKGAGHGNASGSTSGQAGGLTGGLTGAPTVSAAAGAGRAPLGHGSGAAAAAASPPVVAQPITFEKMMSTLCKLLPEGTKIGEGWKDRDVFIISTMGVRGTGNPDPQIYWNDVKERIAHECTGESIYVVRTQFAEHPQAEYEYRYIKIRAYKGAPIARFEITDVFQQVLGHEMLVLNRAALAASTVYRDLVYLFKGNHPQYKLAPTPKV